MNISPNYQHHGHLPTWILESLLSHAKKGTMFESRWNRRQSAKLHADAGALCGAATGCCGEGFRWKKWAFRSGENGWIMVDVSNPTEDFWLQEKTIFVEQNGDLASQILVFNHLNIGFEDVLTGRKTWTLKDLNDQTSGSWSHRVEWDNAIHKTFSMGPQVMNRSNTLLNTKPGLPGKYDSIG